MAEEEDYTDTATNIRKQLDVMSKETAFLKKYFSLRKRCEQLQQSNEKMVNRIQHAKKLIKRYKRDKRFLTSRLDEHGDNFREAQVPYMWEEDNALLGVRPVSSYNCGGSDSETEGRSRHDQKSALSSIQPLLNAHGLGHLDLKSKKLKLEKEKDPNAPKKPANAFLMFCQTQRASVQEEYLKEHKEEIAHHELTKTLAQQWNVLVPEEKRIYYNMYEKEKERYEREMRNYKPKQETTTDSASSSMDPGATAEGSTVKEESLS